jgi:DNA primase
VLSRDVIEAIRERVDIVELISQSITLQRKGNSHMGLCPFHQEKSPSFSVVPHKGIFHCFGCGEGGDAFKFLMKTRGIGFHEAVKELGEHVGIQVEDRELSPDERRRMRARRDVVEVNELAAGWFQSNLLTRPEGRPALEYLQGRGMSADVIERYRLGAVGDGWSGLLDYLHAQGVPAQVAISSGLARPRKTGNGAYDLFRNRVIIPIYDARGRIVAFGGRVMPGTEDPDRGSPKYVNSPETEIYKKSSILYGLSHARNAIQRTGRILVVEGYFDVLSLHQAGFEEAVATCGTALTPEHMSAIRPLARTVYTLFDLDEAGQRAAVKSLELFLKAGIEPYRLETDAGKDPDELIQEHGPEAFEALITRAEPVIDLLVRRLVSRHGHDAGALDRVLGDLAPVLRLYRDAARFRVVERIARRFSVPVGAVEERLGRPPGPATQARPGAPPRWRGTKALNHLLWLVIHYPVEVGPVLAEADPDIVTDRETVLRAIALLMEGASLPAVLEAVEDADLAHLLRLLGAKEALYTEESAPTAARDILAGLRIKWIRAGLGRIERELATCDSAVDGSRYLDLLRQRASLQRERKELQRR